MARLFELGRRLLERREYPAARQALEGALGKAQGLSDGKSIAEAYGALGDSYGITREFPRAAGYYNLAASVRRSLGDRRELAKALETLAFAYRAAGELLKSAEVYTESISVSNEAGDPAGAERTSTQIAALYRQLNQPAKAVEFLENAVKSLERSGDQKALAGAVNALGSLHYEAGRMEQALIQYQRVLEIAQRIGAPRGVAGALNNLGLLHKTLGQGAKALEYLDRALTLTDPADRSLMGSLLGNLGSLCLGLGKPAQAVTYLERCVELDKASGDRRNLAGSLDSLGIAFAMLGKHDQALQHQNQALELVRPSGDPRAIARQLSNLGATYKAKGDYLNATEHLAQALSLKRKYASPAELAASLSNLALIQFDQGKLEPAAASFAEAIQHNEAVSRQFGAARAAADDQDWFRSSLYRRYAHVLVEQSKPEEALIALERGRNQGLARQVALNRDFSRILGPADAERLRAATVTLENATTDLRKIEGLEFLIDGEPDSPERRRILDTRRTHNEAERRLIELRAEFAEKNAEYRRQSGAEPPTISTLKQLAARNPDTLYLQSAVGAEETSLLFMLSHREGVKALVLPAGEATLQASVRAWRHAITQTDDPKAEAAPSRALYQSLFAEVEKAGYLAAGKFSRLVLVVDGPLLEAPLAALTDASGKRLVERLPVSVSASFGVLTWPDERRKALGPILCAADPVGHSGDPLPVARLEAKAVAALFPGASLLVGRQANRSAVLRDLPRYSLLHFATHGYLDDEDGLRSGLLVTPDGEGGEELLEGRELLNMRLAAQMAVLSACETGKGQRSGGEGLIGLAWAFRAAGCPSVIASLWSVDDAATGVLMVRFYQSLKAGKRKDEALREAMLAMKTRHADPYFWAAFQVNGDTSAIEVAKSEAAAGPATKPAPK